MSAAIRADEREAGRPPTADPLRVLSWWPNPSPKSPSRAHLANALAGVYERLGFDEAAGGDEVFRQLMLARIIEPSSKLDSIRVLQEAGLAAMSYPTINRRLPGYAKPVFRQRFSAAAQHMRVSARPAWCSMT